MERTLQKQVAVSDGSWVVVELYGEPGAPGLVVVPGVMSDAHGWRHVVRATTAWPSVAVVNRRGRAPSGPLTHSYSMQTEVDDLGAVLDELGEPATLFGWSYGGLVALLAANERPVRHVVAYEPVAPPFGSDALPDLAAADATEDWDRAVEIVNRQISGYSAAHVAALRADPQSWATLRRLSQPLYAEIRALAQAPVTGVLAGRAERVDLVVGEHSRGTAPYGTSFGDVRDRVPRAAVHELAGQGHMAHVEDPTALGRMLDALATS
jgi:pimeloyl-ACP methyl ester carboxylesterase